jgi:hypothetical protein
MNAIPITLITHGQAKNIRASICPLAARPFINIPSKVNVSLIIDEDEDMRNWLAP